MRRTIGRLNSVHRQLLDTVSVVDESSVSKRPARDEWSVAEVLHHLCLVETGVLAQLKKLVEEPPQTVPALKKLIPMRVVSWRLFKVKAPRTVLPQNHLSKKELLDTYDETRNRLKEFCSKYGPDRLKLISFRHPALGNIDGVATVEFLGFHELRHLKQIRGIIKKLTQPPLY